MRVLKYATQLWTKDSRHGSSLSTCAVQANQEVRMCDKILRLKEELPHLNARHIIRVNERQERGGMTETMVTVMFQDINALRTLIVHIDMEPYP